MIEITVSLFAIIVAIWYIQRWKHTSMFSDLGIPGPKPSLFFGNMVELYRKGPIKCHEEWIAKYGRIVGFYYGMKRILLVADPQLLKDIYIKDFSKFVDRERFHPLLLNDEKHNPNPDVLSARGQKWKAIRSVLTPTFSTAKMKRMAVTMNDSVRVMMDVFRQQAKTEKYFNIHDSYQRLTMDIISKTSFGLILDIQTNPKSGLLKAAKIIFSTSYFNFLIFVGLSFPMFRGFFFWVQRMIRRISNRGSGPYNTLKKQVLEVIAHRKSNPEARKTDILQLMIDAKITTDGSKVDLRKLEAGDAADDHETSKANEENKTVVRNMSEAEILSSSIVVFLAGYETTSTALAFTSYLLAKYPDVQEKVYEEIKELLSEGNELEYATIKNLPYLDKVLSEAMRVYPPVYLFCDAKFEDMEEAFQIFKFRKISESCFSPMLYHRFTNRVALEDVQYGKLKIPKDTIIQAPCYFLHHDPEYWRNPEVFDPERFNTKPNIDGITYLPFGIGPRNCLGMRFAQMEAKLALAHTVYNFKLHLDNKMQDHFPLSLRIRMISPTLGVIVKLEVRNL